VYVEDILFIYLFIAKFYGHYLDMVKTSNIGNPMPLLVKILGKDVFGEQELIIHS